MSSNNVAVSVRNLSKSYQIAHNAANHTTLGEVLFSRLKKPLQQVEREEFWALKDLSFDIKRGDVVGIIGRNGAGKSTLLKILSQITEPTRGKVELYGRVGSLLEVGTGFHAELTGRENIFLNGSVLGMQRREIQRQFDAIVAFAGVEKFLDTPVKRYSSGMSVRLAFAVAAHLEPEIMIVDEVLSVGDADFQQKCLGKISEIAASGRTVLFVSHHLHTVTNLCNVGLVLANGQFVFQGQSEEAVHLYMQSLSRRTRYDDAPEHRAGSGEYRVITAAPAKAVFDSNEPKVFRFRAEQRGAPTKGLIMRARVVSDVGNPLVYCDSRFVNEWLAEGEAVEGEFCFTTPWLPPGDYWLDLMLASPLNDVDIYEKACSFTISPVLPYHYTAGEEVLSRGLMLADFTWKSQAV